MDCPGNRSGLQLEDGEVFYCLREGSTTALEEVKATPDKWFMRKSVPEARVCGVAVQLRAVGGKRTIERFFDERTRERFFCLRETAHLRFAKYEGGALS